MTLSKQLDIDSVIFHPMSRSTEQNPQFADLHRSICYYRTQEQSLPMICPNHIESDHRIFTTVHNTELAKVLGFATNLYLDQSNTHCWCCHSLLSVLSVWECDPSSAVDFPLTGTA